MDMLQQVIDKFKLNVLMIEDVPQSFSSSVYKIQLNDYRIVYIKIPYSKAKLELEFTVLKRFHYELPVPEILDYWEGNENVTGALLLSAIKGVPIREQVGTNLAYDIGVHHAILHSIVPNEQDYKSVVSNVYGQWSEFIRSHFYSFAEDVKEVIDPRLYEQSLKHFDRQLNLLPSPDGPSFIHMDFRPGNILVHENQVAGIIDFESVRIGATEMDFTKINRDIFMRYPGTRDSYQKGYESIRPLIDLQEVLPFYRFIDAFNSIGWCKRRGIEKHQTFLQENLAYLNRFLRIWDS
ncbi:phosphotransferase [Peribacillus psychrosaccharolyticus]|uniref:Phosphotransferase n=2 Tax=Peribacillus psychrosaccharolyticus TaxID=1407 RepID=A0A974NNR0_PERPY|nr:phosphotransferase [Peribacillus psychrosaccharolyticus]MEC2054149.1 phosphotransferase [Peribacillus psychrosaccharolyticus]MED3742233.1 phosphotransferase [Peribacillus psychrosaccharolyticus]QQT01217.1 phosphotransferase [Peribacillus psychrosaccharolyticus]